MNVYIVSTGRRLEGSTPDAVFQSLRAAREYCAKTYNEWPAIRDAPNAWVSSPVAAELVWIHQMKVCDS